MDPEVNGLIEALVGIAPELIAPPRIKIARDIVVAALMSTRETDPDSHAGEMLYAACDVLTEFFKDEKKD